LGHACQTLPILMTFAWSDHHFLNRHPALDFANTVVYRHLAARRDDRLEGIDSVRAWGRASGFDISMRQIEPLAKIMRSRAAIAAFFRGIATGGEPDPGLWRELVRLHCRHASRTGLTVTPQGLRRGPSAPPPLLSSVLHAAMELAYSPDLCRLKACPSCGWLFIDRTRNRRKQWCIAAMCGNRVRAQRHYERTRRRKSLAAHV